MQIIKKAVILAAGYGTRFLPVTKVIPKEVLPVYNKPVIHYLIEEASGAGFEQILIVVNKSKDSIIKYFDRSIELESLLVKSPAQEILFESNQLFKNTSIYFTMQEYTGTGGAVLAAQNFVGKDPFVVFLGDVLVEDGIEHLKRLKDVYYETNHSVIGINPVKSDRVSSVGIVDIEKLNGNYFTVKKITEKPLPSEVTSNLSVLGRYLLRSSVFTYLNEQKRYSEELDLVPTLNRISNEELLMSVLHEYSVFDIGTPAQWIMANIHYAMRDRQTASKLKEYFSHYFKQ